MADLLKQRVKSLEWRICVKCAFIVFICFATRAVHLELVKYCISFECNKYYYNVFF